MDTWLIGYIVIAFGTCFGIVMAGVKEEWNLLATIIAAILGGIISPIWLVAILTHALIKYIET